MQTPLRIRIPVCNKQNGNNLRNNARRYHGGCEVLAEEGRGVGIPASLGRKDSNEVEALSATGFLEPPTIFNIELQSGRIKPLRLKTRDIT